MGSTKLALTGHKKARAAYALMDKQPLGRHLIDEIYQVMSALGHDALDPVHVIAAAAQDYPPQSAAMDLLGLEGIDEDVARRAARSAPEMVKPVLGGRSSLKAPSFTEFGFTLFEELYDLHQMRQVGGNVSSDTFDWYTEAVRAALQSESRAVEALVSR